jgi:hypothetical protein
MLSRSRLGLLEFSTGSCSEGQHLTSEVVHVAVGDRNLTAAEEAE